MARNTKPCMMDYSALRGKIREVCGTEQIYAKSINRTHAYVSGVFNNYTYFKPEDIFKSCDVLGIMQDDINKYFFTRKVCESEL